MASNKGRESSWNKYVEKERLRQKQQTRMAREHLKRERKMRKFHRTHARRRKEAIAMLFELAAEHTRFGMLWAPVKWARHNTIWELAPILGDLAGPEWTVTPLGDLEGSGKPGWLFERRQVA